MNYTLRHDGNCGSRLVATAAIPKGAVVARVAAGETLPRPTWISLQLDEERHLEEIGFLRYLNHSCAPNLFFDPESLKVEAVRAIAPAEELTLFYPATEWDMAQPFHCMCGTEACLGLISGARRVPAEVLQRYRLSRFIAGCCRGQSAIA